MGKLHEAPERFSPDWLQSLDGRTALAQELRQRKLALAGDLGGMDSLSYQQRALVDRALFLELHLQQEERKLVDGGEFDSGRWVQGCNSLVGVLKVLGLRRKAREVRLADYLEKA